MEPIDILKKAVLPILGLSPRGAFCVPEEGRIAQNLTIETREKGEVLVRFYPISAGKSSLGYGIAQAKFELRTLRYLAERAAPTPRPIQRIDGNGYAIEEGGWFVFAYPLLKGRVVNQKELSKKYAKQAAERLGEIASIGQAYQPLGNEPTGDAEYIQEILNTFLNHHPDLRKEDVFREMVALLGDKGDRTNLLETEKGLVHGDFFFENVLVWKGNLVSVIDFGDAYYGYLLMDIAIGAMEFAMKEGEVWDFEYFRAFLEGSKKRLEANNVSFSLFYHLLLLNCCRFTVHLATLAENSGSGEEWDWQENPYIQRFRYFQKPEIKEKLAHHFNQVKTW